MCVADAPLGDDRGKAGATTLLTAARWLVVAIVVGLFITSCSTKVGHGHGGILKDGFDPSGWEVLAFGWMQVPITGLAGLACWMFWLANPLFVIGLVGLMRRRYRVASVFSSMSLGICLSPIVIFAWNHMEIHLFAPFRIVSYGGPEYLELRFGYILWVLSHATLLLYGLLSSYRRPMVD